MIMGISRLISLLLPVGIVYWLVIGVEQLRQTGMIQRDRRRPGPAQWIEFRPIGISQVIDLNELIRIQGLQVTGQSAYIDVPVIRDPGITPATPLGSDHDHPIGAPGPINSRRRSGVAGVIPGSRMTGTSM